MFLGCQTHKGHVKSALLQGDLDEQPVDDDDDDFQGESAQPVSDTFSEPVPGFSRKLQLEHQCVRLLKAVYDVVNALGVTHVHTVRHTNHTSKRQTQQNMEKGF